MWSHVYLLDGGERLGKTLTGYRDRYFHPEKRNQTVIFSWKPIEGAEEKYKKLEKELLLPLEESDVVANKAAVLTNKLLQMANGAVYDENCEVKEIHGCKA